MHKKETEKVNPADFADVSKLRRHNGEYTFMHEEKKYVNICNILYSYWLLPVILSSPLFLFFRGFYKFCSQCGILKRSDTIYHRHWPANHKDVPAGTHRYLMTGHRPVVGKEHVVRYLDMIGSKTPRPENSLNSDDSQQGSSEAIVSQYYEDQEDASDSRDQYDEDISEDVAQPENVTNASVKGNVVELPAETVKEIKRKKKMKSKKKSKSPKSDGAVPAN